jgi:hypothetical protein
MDSPNSLLLGFYTLLSYSYSQRHTYLTLGSWKRDIQCPCYGVFHEHRKEKNISSFFFKPTVLLKSSAACSKIHEYTYVLVFAVCCAEAGDTPTSSRLKNTGSRLGKRLLLKGILQKPFLTDGSGYKRDCLLV